MPKMGDVREDGYIFRTNYIDRKGKPKEHWLSPAAFTKWQETRNVCSRVNYHINVEKERQRNKTYRENNPHKGNARSAKRRVAKLQAIPNCLSQEHLNEIQDFYMMAKELEKIFPWKQEVDHIEPIQGKDICGLHVLWNLQILPLMVNRSKGIKRGIL